MKDRKLLLTFCEKEDIEKTLEQIHDSYELTARRLYVLATSEPNNMAITFNTTASAAPILIKNTLSIHRNKSTNTLYTVNGLNLILQQKGLKMGDKIDFTEYINCIICTSMRNIRVLKTRLVEVVEV